MRCAGLIVEKKKSSSTYSAPLLLCPYFVRHLIMRAVETSQLIDNSSFRFFKWK
jgi:hypothetical protein